MQPLQITLTGQSLIGAVAILGAFVAIINYIKKIFGWFDKQERQDKEIKDIKEEQTILTEGILACLKGLQEQGCDGEVTKAISKIEAHLNKKAHGG
jgi:hypothetical protein